MASTKAGSKLRLEKLTNGLDRFHSAQKRIYRLALSELVAGRKRSHWMWFVFPQIAGLGSSEASLRFAISDIDEAKQYLQDPVLGNRLRECISATLKYSDRSPREIFGDPDDIKFKSCLTLFEIADPEEPLFKLALKTFYEGDRDARTIELLAHQ